MNAFDKIIGYEPIKKELLQIVDMIRNRSVYEALGAKFPHGVLLHGDPGLGKTLMAKCFIEESGLPAFVVRRNKGSDDFIGDITATFEKAKENTPCIVFLDDMDKFANEDERHRDAEEYVAVQSGIDEVKNCDVFVLATANDVDKLPSSLQRPGRFDRKIEVNCPSEKDAEAIIAHYLADKQVSESVDLVDLAKMISYHSCAELETILNEAAINAAYERRQSIAMDDLVKAVLRMQYDSPGDYTKTSAEGIRKTALHEAGHLVVSEVLCPGIVGLASLRSAGDGFVHHSRELPRRPYFILVSLAGKAAVELYYADTCASGCQSDIKRAFNIIRSGMSENATLGLGMVNVATRFFETSENMNARSEAVTHAELERYMLKAKEILLNNREFLEKATEALIEKGTLLHSDIRAIRESLPVIKAAV